MYLPLCALLRGGATEKQRRDGHSSGLSRRLVRADTTGKKYKPKKKVYRQVRTLNHLSKTYSSMRFNYRVP
jgi:hypothetical protein